MDVRTKSGNRRTFAFPETLFSLYLCPETTPWVGFIFNHPGEALTFETMLQEIFTGETTPVEFHNYEMYENKLFLIRSYQHKDILLIGKNDTLEDFSYI